MKQLFTLLAAVLLTATTYAQIGINNETQIHLQLWILLLLQQGY